MLGDVADGVEEVELQKYVVVIGVPNGRNAVGKSAIAVNSNKELQEIKIELRCVEILKDLTDNEITKVAHAINTVKYSNGDKITNELKHTKYDKTLA